MVHGEWHLWIYCCDWQVLQENQLVAHSESNRADISRGTAILEGQLLESVTLEPRSMRTVFRFDLGGLLRTEPYGEDDQDEQWFLHGPEEAVLTVRASGHWSLGKGSSPTETWQALFE